MTIWDNPHDIVQLVEMCVWLPINVALCIPAIAVYFGRECYLLFHLLTGFKLVPRNSKIDRDLVKHRWSLYLLIHIYVFYCLWNVVVTIIMIIRPLVDNFFYNQIFQRIFYTYNLQWYFTLVAAFTLVWSRAANIWIQERNSKLLSFATNQLLMIVLGIVLLVAFVMHTVYLVVIPLNRGGIMHFDVFIYFSTTVSALTFTILGILAVLIIAFGVIIIVLMTRSNNMLLREWREKGKKVPKKLMDRVTVQRWTIFKFFCIMIAVLIGLAGKTAGHIMFTMQANQTLAKHLPPWLIEWVLRGPPDWLLLLTLAIVFWPWKMPGFVITLLTSCCAIDAESMPVIFQPIEFVRDRMPGQKGEKEVAGDELNEGEGEDGEKKEQEQHQSQGGEKTFEEEPGMVTDV